MKLDIKYVQRIEVSGTIDDINTIRDAILNVYKEIKMKYPVVISSISGMKKVAKKLQSNKEVPEIVELLTTAITNDIPKIIFKVR